jgi:hypothetical protein
MRISQESKNYWKAFGIKCLENLASVKVWLFMLPFVVSTIALWILVGYHIHFITEALKMVTGNNEYVVPVLQQMKTISDMFIDWCTFNVSLGGMVIVIRETFKVSKLKALNEEKRDNSKEINSMDN